MALAIGTAVGRYQIQSLLGSGGMGEVYKAVDPVLGRPVALKVLRPELSGDPDRLDRFLHEARAASALNHPNILTIHEVGEHDGSRYLISEFVEGETLRERVNRGPLTLREMLDIAIQVASALSAAHDAGIVHRDIKPDNLMLRPDGYVKVLDFGVATFAQRSGSADAAATIAPDPAQGMVVGTIAYMSPEQARGLAVDGRSDCYSLGVVLYELIAGRAPFAASTSTDLLVAILEREAPSLRSLARGVPLPFEWIVEKSLEKDMNLRYQTMGDLRVDLQRCKNALESGRLPTAVTEAAADVIVERNLSADSPEVIALGRMSRTTIAYAVVSFALFAVAATYYAAARPGADLPLQLPEGGVITRARAVVAELGYADPGSRTSVSFQDALDIDDINDMAGLAAAREAIRDGRPVAYWRAGITHTDNPDGGLEPDAGDYSVRLGPRGQLVAFATGYATDAGIAHPDRDRAVAIGLEAVRKSLGIDASAYEVEVVPRTFPPGKTELIWRSKDLHFAHVEQVRVNLQGERLILIERSLQLPRDYQAPEAALLTRVFNLAGPIILAVVFVIGWGFGLYYLFTTRNWDALTKPLPLALCAIVVLQVGLSTIGSSNAVQSLLAIVIVTILLVGTALPALSGAMSWIRRRSPERLWSAEELTRGHLQSPAVAASLVDGVIAGAAMAAIGVGADWAALQLPGFEPSISRELGVVDAGIGEVSGEVLSAGAFLLLAIAFVVEVFDYWRLNAALSTAIIAVCAGLFAASDQHAMLPALVLIGGMGLSTVLVVLLYRRRGFLAAWVAGVVSALLVTMMALRSLDDSALQQSSNILAMIVVVVGLAGAWGAGRQWLGRPSASTQTTAS